VLEAKEAMVLSQEVQLVGRFVHSLQLAEHCTQLVDVILPIFCSFIISIHSHRRKKVAITIGNLDVELSNTYPLAQGQVFPDKLTPG